MADFTVVRAKSASLAAGAVDNITLSCNTKSIEIINRDATNPISITVGPNVAAADPRYPATPTSLGDNCLVVPPGRSLVVRWPGTPMNPPAAIVRLVGPSATIPYTVQGIDPTVA
jgi:hypothetical protein